MEKQVSPDVEGGSVGVRDAEKQRTTQICHQPGNPAHLSYGYQVADGYEGRPQVHVETHRWCGKDGLILQGLLTSEAHRCPSSNHPPRILGTDWGANYVGGVKSRENDGGKQWEA